LTKGSKKEICGHVFQNYGSHSDNYPVAYLTASAAIGIKKEDVDLFVKRLEKVLDSNLVTKTADLTDSVKQLSV
jgi:O-phospho-L-seryl-tRNASec:L-selenocysteinyl-tRNA synthase